MFIKKLRSKKGFTLVEVMIAVAVMSGLALSLATLMKNLTKTTSKAQSDSDMLMALNEINAILANPRSCALTFGAGAFPSNGTGTNSLPYSALTNIVSKPNSTSTPVNKYTVNTAFGNNQTQISSYLLAVDPGNTANGAIFTITFKKSNFLSNGQTGAVVGKQIKLYVEYDTATNTKIAACRSVSSAFDDVWSRQASNQANIYYALGNVGIGTTTPTSMLQVVGGIIRSDTGTTGPSLIGTGTGSNFQVTHDGSANVAIFNSGGGIQFRDTNGTTNLMSILSGGNVGVGTIGPLSKLDVQGTSGTDTLHISNNGGSAYLYSYSTAAVSASIGAYGGGAPLPLILEPGGGNVGIGTSTPGAPLAFADSLADKIQINGNNANQYKIGKASPVSTYATGDSMFQMVAGSTTPGEFGFYNGSTLSMMIDKNGNVGIGTTSPKYKLEITTPTVGAANSGVSITGAANTYAPLYIQNQPLTDIDSYTVTNPSLLTTSVSGTEVPTKNWVRRQFGVLFTNASPDTVGQIATEIAAFANSNTMEVIRATVCSNFQLYSSATGITNVGLYTAGTLTTPGTCVLVASFDCTNPGRCGTIYATTVSAAQVISAQHCDSNGGTHCYTTMGRYKCPSGWVMNGLSNGMPICQQITSGLNINSGSAALAN